MSRRRMLMLQQAGGYELVYNSSIGALPLTSEWEGRKINGTPYMTYTNGYLQLRNMSGGNRFGLIPVERQIAQTKNISISADIRLSDRLNPGFTLIVTNGDTAAWFTVYAGLTPNAETLWEIKVCNSTGREITVTTKQLDVINNFVNLKLNLIGDTYACYINDEVVYTEQAISCAVLPTEYQYNMLLNSSASWGYWDISTMRYKEW